MRMSSKHPPLADLLPILAHPKQRAILTTLQQAGQLTVAELASTLEAEEQRESLEIALYHLHLPKLDAVGVLEFDPDQGVVRASDATTAALSINDELGETLEGELPSVHR